MIWLGLDDMGLWYGMVMILHGLVGLVHIWDGWRMVEFLLWLRSTIVYQNCIQIHVKKSGLFYIHRTEQKQHNIVHTRTALSSMRDNEITK